MKTSNWKICLLAALVVGAFALVAPVHVCAATVGTVSGTVVDIDARAISGVSIAATAPSGQYLARTDARGHFVIFGVVPDSYKVTFSVDGYEMLIQNGITVLPGSRVMLEAVLQPVVKQLAREVIRASRLGITRTTDEYLVVGTAARAQNGISTAGLSSYVRGTVQGALAGVPGVSFDTFGDAIVRGGKANETAYTYEEVPMPQSEVAEPGGNPISASLATTGVAYTTVDTGAFSVADENVLSGVIDQVATLGTNPSQQSYGIGQGLLGRAFDQNASVGWANSDLSSRSYVAARSFNDAIEYGDRHAFYPAEIATYGLGLQSQGGWSALGNFHARLHDGDDVQLFLFGGQAAYDVYSTPYSGETFGSFGPYPGAPNLTAQVDAASRVRGTYSIQKLQLTRPRQNSLVRFRLYQSYSASTVFGPWWDDLSFPSGPISLASNTKNVIGGLAADIESQAGAASELHYGGVVEEQHYSLAETIPIVPELLTSSPPMSTFGVYIADKWDARPWLGLEGGIRYAGGVAHLNNGSKDNFVALDPRGAASFHVDRHDDIVRLWAGKYTQFPSPLEVERIVTAGNRPSVLLAPLSPQTASDSEVSFGHAGSLSYKLTAFARHETNLIDVVPTNFRTPGVVSGTAGTSLGVALPQNVGSARISGFEFGLESNRANVDATYTKGYSTSASPFGLNALNAPAATAGHVFPLSFIPALQATASYRFAAAHLEIVPTLTFESGYPYGNGKQVYIYCASISYECASSGGKPSAVLNDNNVNPGYNYYFLRNPALPYCPQPLGCAGGTRFNPITGNLGTPEGNDPFTLRSPPALYVALHINAQLTRSVSASLGVTNLLNHTNPSQYEGNPWLIGPPGYAGSPGCSSAYAKYYGGAAGIGSGCYTLGNGIPTLNGQTPAVPWTYGTQGYVPTSWPAPQSVYLRLEWHNV